MQDEETIQLYLDDPNNALGQRLHKNPQVPALLKSNYDYFTIDRTPGAGASGETQIFYRREFLRRHWSNYLKVVSVTPKGYYYQTAFLLEK